jgi:two-component system sensor histidine kinase/response regulator
MERLRVLVVDDEPRMRAGIQRALRSHVSVMPDLDGEVDYEVVEAASGEAALERIAEAVPDILLLDHKLPGIQGLELLDKLTREGPRVLTVMITAYASIETAVTATKRGAYDFLAKPFTPAELGATIDKAARHVLLDRRARKLALERRQARFQLISVVAHELKAPLAAIEGYLQLLQDPATGADAESREHMLARSVLRLQGMRKLIFDLLDLTRIESGQKKRELATVDLGELAGLALDGVRGDAEHRRIALRLVTAGDLVMTGDRGELEIILNNLVSNAVKYNRDGGEVELALRGEAELLTIAVRDTGIGISDEEQAKLFGEFSRIKNAQTRNILGSGLGLSIVRRLARLNGGDAGVTSTAGVGSTFTVTLARSGSAEAAAVALDAALEP